VHIPEAQKKGTAKDVQGVIQHSRAETTAETMVDMVGIEPTTSSMPQPLLNVLSITYRPLGTAKQRGNTPKADI